MRLAVCSWVWGVAHYPALQCRPFLLAPGRVLWAALPTACGRLPALALQHGCGALEPLEAHCEAGAVKFTVPDGRCLSAALRSQCNPPSIKRCR